MSRSENLAKKRRNDPIGREAGIPLTGQIAHDRYVIENRQKDIAKRDSNILRAGVAGAAAGAVLGRGRLPFKARLAAGALAGAGSVIGVRAVTQKKGRDVYGARQPWAARSEAAPAVIGTGAAGYGVYRILRKKFLKMSDARPVTEFGSAGIRRITRRYYANLAKGTIVSGSPASLQGGGFTVNNTMKQRWSGVSHKLFPEHQIVSDVRPHIPFLERMKNLNGRMGTAKDLQTIDNIGRPRLHPVNYMREEKGKLVRGPLRESYAHASNPSLAKTDYAKIIQKAKRQKKTRGVLSITDFPDTRSITVAKVSPLEIAHSKGTDKLMRRAKADKHYFAKKEKRQMNPYLMAGLSGAASGAALGILPLLRRGVGLKTALRTAAGGAAAGGAIVGGGSLLGSAILGDPDKKEGAAFTKRAAVGGALVGGTLGVAGGLVARRVPVVRSQVKKLAKEWRPANAIRKSGPIKAAAIGGVAGGAYGGAMGADEGQQVDSIRNIRKDLKRMHGFEFANKDWRDARRESRSEAAKDYMTGGGALAAGVGLGGGVGYLGWRGGKAMNQVAATAKEASKATRSARVAGAKINRASTWIKRQMTTFPTFRKLRIRLEATTDALEFEKPFSGYNKKRHARTGGLNDSYRKQYNREHGSNLKRPVTTEPSKLKPGSKAAKRRASFCARMGGMQGPTSKDGKLTPKGAALKRWNCSARLELIEFNQRKKEEGSLDQFGNSGRTAAALGLGIGANTIAAGAALAGIQSQRQAGMAAGNALGRVMYSKKGGITDLPKSSATLDRFARRKGYTVVDSNRPAVRHNPRTFFRHRHDPVGIRAHEAGHVAQRGKKFIGGTLGRRLYQPASLAGALAGSVSTDPSQDKKATAIAGIATAASVPVMASEIDASVRGYKMARRLGESRRSALGAFKGLPSYAAIAAIPATAWALRKRSQAKKQAKAELASNRKLIEMNDRTYRPGSTAEIRSMKQTPAVKEILTKENARGKWKHRLRTLMKVLPFEARYEFQTMAPMAPNPYDERDRLKRQLLVTGAVATPVAGVGYAGFRSLKKSAAAIQKEEARRTLGQELRRQRAAASAVGGEVRRGKTGPRGPITRAPLPMRKSMLPETLGRNAATNRAIDMGKRYESEINARTKTRPLIRPEGDVVMQKYKTKGPDGQMTERQRAKWQGGKWKTAGKSKEVFIHSRGERMKMRAALAALRTKYKFAQQGGLHEFNIYTRDAETGRAASFWDQAQGRRLTRKNPLTGEVEDAPITTRSFISAARRESERLNRTRRRGTGLVKDVGEVMQGKKTKKREWEKSWFRRGVENTLGAGALLAGGLVYKRGLNKSAPKWARKFRAAMDPANEGQLHPKDWKGPSLTVRAKRKTAAAEDWLGKKLNLSARLQSSVTQFDYYQDYYGTQGWDLRDARGNSARVFSPKAKKRTRRPAEWYEKKEGERKILGAAGLLGSAAAATAGVVIGRRFPSKKLYTKRRNRPSRDKGGGPVIDLRDYAK